MTVVFVHGVPETASVWDRVRDRIGGESVALALPGFGTPRPPGFDGKDAWAGWLRDRLAELPGPVDLVGHDWGALLALRVVTTSPGLVRSWAVDVASVAHPDYTWHDFALTWQTPQVGEEWMRAQLAAAPGDPDGFFDQLVAFAVPPADAKQMAAEFDAEMAASILALYRSAVPNLWADWGCGDRPDAPGLVLLPTADPFDDPVRARIVADWLGAAVAELPGLGHFWPLEDPATAAGVLGSWLRARG